MVVDFVGDHADGLGDTIGQRDSTLNIFLCVLGVENCHVHDLQRNVDSLELCRQVLALNELLDALQGQLARASFVAYHFALRVTWFGWLMPFRSLN